jgi:two-component system, cell cycle response regulator DivK
MTADSVRIVYVEDDADNVYVLTRRLGRRGYDVTVASDGAAGIETVRKLKPALVLMDMSLPVIDGWEATRRIKGNPVTAAIPVIALTAHAMAGDREKAMEAGCDDYDTKPIELPALLDKIARLTGG